MKKKLTKEQKNRIKNLLIGGVVLSVVGCIIGGLIKSNIDLTNKNRELERKNSNLKGRNKSIKDENRRLVKENYEVCYHLGKKSMTHPKIRIIRK